MESSLPPHFLDREVHVIVSILSGRHKAKEFYDDSLKPVLDRHGIKYSTHETKSTKTIIELTQHQFLPNARQGVKQTLVLLSGDGGVVDIVNTLTSTLKQKDDDVRSPSAFIKPVVVLIPMGTANALAWSSKVAHNPLKVMMEGTPQPLPSFQVCFSPGAKLVVNEGQGREALSEQEDWEAIMYGAVVFSWGLHASLVAMSDTAEYRKHGLDRFKMAAQELLNESHPYRGKVKWRDEKAADWTNLTGPEHSYVLASMVSNLEEHFQISPATRPLDGDLRLVSVGVEDGSEIMRILGQAYQSGKHVTDPKVLYERIEGLRIDMEENEEQWRLVCVDGKIVALPKDGWVEITRNAGTGMESGSVVELVC